MVERMARTIESAMFAPHELPLPDALHAKYLDTARVAIEAMRDPTVKMYEASRFPNAGSIGDQWRAMIDAALDEKK